MDDLKERLPAWAAIAVLYSAMAGVIALWAWSTRPPAWGVAVAWLLATALFVLRVRRVHRARLQRERAS